MRSHALQPEGWKPPKGYSNGILIKDPSRFVFVAGQIAWDAQQELVGRQDFVAQFRQALANVVAVVREGGGYADHVVRLTIYVTDKALYLQKTRELGQVYREIMGDHYPAMALVQVAALLEDDALVEIEATAALP